MSDVVSLPLGTIQSSDCYNSLAVFTSSWAFHFVTNYLVGEDL